MITAHIFIATSLDGFIGQPGGDIDWLLPREVQSEDHGYLAFTVFLATKPKAQINQEYAKGVCAT